MKIDVMNLLKTGVGVSLLSRVLVEKIGFTLELVPHVSSGLLYYMWI